MSKLSSKRVDIVKIKMVKESSIKYSGRKITSPKDVISLASDFILEMDREVCIVIGLDVKNQPCTLNICSIGSLNASIVHPREVFKSAILSNAASIIFVHNHPSGDPKESKEDISITERLKESGKILGISLLDHIIMGDKNSFISFKEKGIL